MLKNLRQYAVEWSGEAFRNIATCDPSQDLFDDMVDPDDYAIVFELEQMTRGIDSSRPTYERVFQYGDIDRSTLCLEKFFNFSRFSDGSFGVWYGALEENTSIKETSYQSPVIDTNDLSNANGPIVQCRRLFKARLRSLVAVDLRPLHSNYPDLTSEDYQFCHSLAVQARSEGVELFFTPSARAHGGTCILVFTAKVIKEDQALRTYLVIHDKKSRDVSYAILIVCNDGTDQFSSTDSLVGGGSPPEGGIRVFRKNTMPR